MGVYQCNNFGSCAAADHRYRIEAPVGSAPSCVICNMPLVPQVKHRRYGSGMVRSWGIAAVVVAVAGLGWPTVHWLMPYSLIGQWRAESAVVVGFPLPVGVNLTFAETSARLSDSALSVPVTYDRDGARVKVFLPSIGGPMQMTPFTFVFESRDRMYWDGPASTRFHYRRVKER